MSSLEKAESLEQLRWLQNGYKIKVGLTDIETIGIDTPDDLERAEEFSELRCFTDCCSFWSPGFWSCLRICFWIWGRRAM